MHNLSQYILEKLKVTKDTKLNKQNKYCDIYNVHEGDIVLCLCNSSKSTSSIKYVQLFIAKIYSINDDKIIVKTKYNIINEIKYIFENPYHSSTHIPKTFAFWQDNNHNWSALMKKDNGIKLIDNQLNKKPLNFISSFRFDPGGSSKKQKLNELKKELEDN